MHELKALYCEILKESARSDPRPSDPTGRAGPGNFRCLTLKPGRVGWLVPPLVIISKKSDVFLIPAASTNGNWFFN